MVSPIKLRGGGGTVLDGTGTGWLNVSILGSRLGHLPQRLSGGLMVTPWHGHYLTSEHRVCSYWKPNIRQATPPSDLTVSNRVAASPSDPERGDQPVPGQHGQEGKRESRHLQLPRNGRQPGEPPRLATAG